jgi:hypothetical protein
MPSRGFVCLMIMLIIVPVSISAQNQRLERLESYKIAFFTRRLNLSSGEAEKFWPVYNEFQKQKNVIQAEKAAIIRIFNQNETTLSQTELINLGDKLIATITQESALAVTFHMKLKEVLPPAKVIRLYQVENQYRVQLLNELQERRQPLN